MIHIKLAIVLVLVSACGARLLHQQTNGNLSYYEAMLQKESNLKASLAQIMAEIQYLNLTLAQL